LKTIRGKKKDLQQIMQNRIHVWTRE